MKENSGSLNLEVFTTAEDIEKVVSTHDWAFGILQRLYGNFYLLCKGYNATCDDLVMCKSKQCHEPSVNLYYTTVQGNSYGVTIPISEFVKTCKGKWIKYSYKVEES